MNAVEAIPLILVYALVIYLSVSNFITTSNGYLAVIEARTSLLTDALNSAPTQPLAGTPPREAEKLSPYSHCGSDSEVYIANGYLGMAKYAGRYGGKMYYLLIPSPNYYTPEHNQPKPKKLQCLAPLFTSAVRSFYVLPDGAIMYSPQPRR